MARNVAGIVHPERLLALAVAVWLLSLAAAWLARKGGLPNDSAVNATFVGVVVLMSGGRILRSPGGGLGWLVIALVIGAAGILLHKLRGTSVVSFLITAMWVGLATGIVFSLYLSWREWAPETVVRPAPAAIEMESQPDIFVVVLDGYPGLLALAQDFDPVDDSFSSQLKDRGFQVPESAWSSYWTTSLSIASLLQMSHPVVEAGGAANEASLQEIIGGDNSLVTLLRKEGYRIHMIESGWTLGGCGANVDVCAPSHAFDDAMFLTLIDTVAGPALQRMWGYPFTVGSLRTMTWMMENARDLSDTPSPDFVFAHVLVPHPPFFLDSECQTTVEHDRTGVNFHFSGVSVQDRERFFLSQVDCVNGFLLDIVDMVQPDDVLVFVGDHGTDRRDQQTVPGEMWDEEAIVERMNVFTAVRVPGLCGVGDSVMLPELMRIVLACLGSIDHPEPSRRMFLNEMVELDSQRLSLLLGGN